MIPEKTNLLVQKRLLRGVHRYELTGADSLMVTHKRVSSSSSYRVALNTLGKDPIHYRNIPMAAWVVAVFLSLAALIFAALWIRASGPDGISFIWISVFFAVLSAIGWGAVYQRHYNILSFCHRFTGEQVLVLSYNNPDKQTFDSFCESLKKNIEEAGLLSGGGIDSGSIADQIAKLKKLLDSGALSEAEFQKAKDKLLEEKPARAIGFHQ